MGWFWYNARMPDDNPNHPGQDEKPQVLDYFNAKAMQAANQKAGRWLTKIVMRVICGIAGVLLLSMAVAVPIIRHRARQTACASNLQQIGQAMQLYANNNKYYPRTPYDPTKPLGNGFTSAGAADPFGPGGVAVNDPTAAMFLLVWTTELDPTMFVCPSSGQTVDTLALSLARTYPTRQRSNFTGPNNLSYSFTNMYPGTAALKLGYKWSPNVTADFAIAADRNDADPKAFAGITSASPQAQQRKLNSHNHKQDGQNVLYNDGHVEWHATPWAGAKKDNIYSSAQMDTNGNQLDPAASAPLWPDPQIDLDTVLVPRKGNGF